MPSARVTSGKSAFSGQVSPEDAWVNVTWMPHASTSQTSHVCVLVRSAHTFTDEFVDHKPQEWKVSAMLCGLGRRPLVPVSSITPCNQVLPRKINQQGKTSTELPSKISEAIHDCRWDHLIHIPARWRDLPRDAFLLLSLLDHTGEILSSTKLRFFTEYGRLSTGLMRLNLEPSKGRHPPLVTVSEDFFGVGHEDPVWKASKILEKLDSLDTTRTGVLPSAVADNRKVFGQTKSAPWLDQISREYCQNVVASTEDSKGEEKSNLTEGPKWQLFVEVPVFDLPIMYEESFYPVPQQASSGAVSALNLSLHRKSVAAVETGFHPLQLVNFVDYESEMDNPAEDKYRTLAHDLLRGLVDPALKPDREQRDRLAAIISDPSHHPSREEKDLLWRFRFSLVDNHKALTKFLLAVDWTVESEVVQAAELLEQWRRLDIPDALKLLGKHVAFQTNLVKNYAIDTLATAPDVELRLYLLQLVQALKYETMLGPDTTRPATRVGSASESNTSQVSSLAFFLIGRAAGNLQLANYLYWYLKVELQDPTHGAKYQVVFSALKARLSEMPFRAAGSYSTLERTASTHTEGEGIKELKSNSFKSIVSSVSSKLGSSLRGTDNSMPCDHTERNVHRTFWDILESQDQFISGLMDIQMKCREGRGKKDAKEAQLQSLLSSEGYNRNRHRNPVPLPSQPHVFVNGVNPQTAKMFKSALYPALVDFHVETTLPMIGEAELRVQSNSCNTSTHQTPPVSKGTSNSLDHLSNFKVIVKTGDDLRQDQLVIMLIQLMDGLLKRAALNLCLTPYSIIAMSQTSGLVEFVDGSLPISQILSNHNGSILQYFQTVAPQNGGKYDVRPDVLSTYVRSCAGYCVITYLLAVGDRHLDNIMLCSSGHFFHIDFGFIFGRDPKPLPPAFRLTREMVEGMGGLESSEYRQFCSLSCQAFNSLRKSAGLILNLLHLMSDAGIEDLSNNPSADAEGVIAKVEERFRLELNDEQAERYFIGLINDCLTALAPRVMDVLHSLAVARR